MKIEPLNFRNNEYEALLRQPFEKAFKIENLPDTILNDFIIVHAAIAKDIHESLKNTCSIIGVNGGQGSGKSTFVQFQKIALELLFNIKAATLSIDDLYLTRDERLALGNRVHALLKTRGQPGTHDIPLGLSIFNHLKNAQPDTITKLVRFNKAIDDRHKQEDWFEFQGCPDVILFEGWCVGSEPQDENELLLPINELEENEDPEGVYRKYVNQQLGNSYKTLFEKINYLITIQIPSFELVQHWREKQEKKLAKKSKPGTLNKIMNKEEIYHFVQHFERITRQNLIRLPKKSNVVLNLDESHKITALKKVK